MPEITYEVQITKTQRYNEVWEHVLLYCPRCGEQKVFENMSIDTVPGTHVCAHCGASMGLEFDAFSENLSERRQRRLAAIRALLGVPPETGAP